ncbi:hypothetical protein [Leptolyngbya sp. NIES-2104]|uniref:hypothetical protein n=1 Tax=Leptolyngbya sp. NIES-2104 TaxID=1552121 RepID=UPI0006EC7628|nr:hypothetical protein [Leptolyngbya sp. NIES-2104]GAP99139.1 hypothetical protein NIES2104_56970 [Leptolyngbya sp. NIES-2104]
MNDLDKNHIRRLENQISVLTQQLIQANHDIARLHIHLGNAIAESDSIDWQRTGTKIEGRIAALESLKFKQSHTW